MKKTTIVSILYILVSFSCTRDNETDNCGCNGPKTEFVKKIFGVVVETDDGFEILTDEKGLLIPCSGLTEKFKIHGQAVTVSGTLRVPCKKIPGESAITPIQISQIKMRNSGYDKTDISLNIIKRENYGYSQGFGYLIEDLRVSHGLKILQPHIPAISGLIPFDTPTHATEAGMLVIFKMRKTQDLPSLSIDVLKYVNIIQ